MNIALFSIQYIQIGWNVKKTVERENILVSGLLKSERKWKSILFEYREIQAQ